MSDTPHGRLIVPASTLFGPDSWQARAIEATRGNQSRLGAIVMAVLGQTPKEPPAFGLGAVITSDGYIMCDFLTRDGELHTAAFVGAVADLVDNCRGLADHLKLADDERLAFFQSVRAWVKRDYRAVSQLF